MPTTIILKTRILISDNIENENYIETYDTDNVFIIPEPNVVSIISVLINNVEISDSEYSFNSDNKHLTINSTLTSGDTVQIVYSFYPNYSDTELINYIQASLVHISLNKYEDFIYDDGTITPTPTAQEENLIAVIASIIINPENKSYRLPDITINVPASLPTNQLIAKTINIFKRGCLGVFDVILTDYDFIENEEI
jgi:hypothetical protein